MRIFFRVLVISLNCWALPGLDAVSPLPSFSPTVENSPNELSGRSSPSAGHRKTTCCWRHFFEGLRNDFSGGVWSVFQDVWTSKDPVSGDHGFSGPPATWAPYPSHPSHPSYPSNGWMPGPGHLSQPKEPGQQNLRNHSEWRFFIEKDSRILKWKFLTRWLKSPNILG